jgi:excisionase family DNA binding protein
MAIDEDRVLTPLEVGELFGVDARTVVRWAKDRRLESFTTLGGHHRFRWSDIAPHLRHDPSQTDPAPVSNRR